MHKEGVEQRRGGGEGGGVECFTQRGPEQGLRSQRKQKEVIVLYGDSTPVLDEFSQL